MPGVAAWRWALGACVLLAGTHVSVQLWDAPARRPAAGAERKPSPRAVQLSGAGPEPAPARRPAAAACLERQGGPRSARNVYVDLGAGWADTLRLFRDLAGARPGPWEVYAFEANPLVQPYVEDFVQHLNGRGPRPLLLVPPSGSSLHLAAFAGRYGCPTLAPPPGGGLTPDAVLEGRIRQCMLEAFQEPLSRLAPRTALRNEALVANRMAEVRTRCRAGQHDNYTFIPAAAGVENGSLHVGSLDVAQMIYRGAHSVDAWQHKGVQMEVPLVDVASWIVSSFSDDDFVLLKMDVEGAEFAIVNRLLGSGGAGRIDSMLLDCHPWAGDCSGLQQRILTESHIQLLSKGRGDTSFAAWDSFSGPHVYYPIDPRPAPAGGRNIFLDMGANWANTLRLYKDLAAFRRGPWEVYAFEASPLIQPYVEDFVRHLNGLAPKPPLLVPPAGSTRHLARLAGRYDCGGHGDVWDAAREIAMRDCMWERFKEPLSQLRPNVALNDSALIAQRMAEARRPVAAGEPDRFTFIPAAVGAANGRLHLGMVDAKQMVRGGAHSGGPLQRSGAQMDVPLVDVATWIMDSFSDSDFVFLKMDVEGAEFAIMSKLMDNHAADRVKLLTFECHSWAGSCPSLERRIAAETRVMMIGEAVHEGWDSASAPAVYYPADPREGQVAPQ